jgi:hypothetical protein
MSHLQYCWVVYVEAIPNAVSINHDELMAAKIEPQPRFCGYSCLFGLFFTIGDDFVD